MPPLTVLQSHTPTPHPSSRPSFRPPSPDPRSDLQPPGGLGPERFSTYQRIVAVICWHGAKEGRHNNASTTGTSDIDTKLWLWQKPNFLPALAALMPNRGDGPAAVSSGAIVSPPRISCPLLDVFPLWKCANICQRVLNERSCYCLCCYSSHREEFPVHPSAASLHIDGGRLLQFASIIGSIFFFFDLRMIKH